MTKLSLQETWIWSKLIEDKLSQSMTRYNHITSDIKLKVLNVILNQQYM